MTHRKPTQSYRLHKETGKAIVNVYDADGRRRGILLPGKFESKESRNEYKRLSARLNAKDGALPRPEAKALDLAVAELIVGFMEERVIPYSVDRVTKQLAGEQENFRCAMRPLDRNKSHRNNPIWPPRRGGQHRRGRPPGSAGARPELGRPERPGTAARGETAAGERRVLVLSGLSEEQIGMSVLGPGASGFLTKENAAEELVEAIRKIHYGQKVISPKLAEECGVVRPADFGEILLRAS
jgi:hypothetical protein